MARRDCLVLANDALVERLLHAQQPVGFIDGEFLDWHTGPAG